MSNDIRNSIMCAWDNAKNFMRELREDATRGTIDVRRVISAGIKYDVLVKRAIEHNERLIAENKRLLNERDQYKKDYEGVSMVVKGIASGFGVVNDN